MLLLLIPALALAAPKTFSPEGKGATVELAVGDSAVNRAGAISSENDILSTITLRKAEGGEAEITFQHSDHCLMGRPDCPFGTITKSKNTTLQVGKPELFGVLWTTYTFTLREADNGKARLEIRKPSGKLLSKRVQKKESVELRGLASGVSSVNVSITSGARSTDFGKNVTVPVAKGHWVATFGEVPRARYDVYVNSGTEGVSLTQGHLEAR